MKLPSGNMALRIALLCCFSLLFCSCLSDQREGTGPSGKAKDSIEWIPTGTKSLPEAKSPPEIKVAGGDTLEMIVELARKTIQGFSVRRIAFNGSSPGPFLKVRQGDTFFVKLRNRAGLPFDFRCQGSAHTDVSGTIGNALADGRDSVYRLSFRDPGAFWYNDGLRPDLSRSMVGYGNILVTPRDETYWNPVDREVPILIGEMQLDSLGLAPFRKNTMDHALLGRFGNVFLANGEPEYLLTLKRMEYVRFHVTNTCNSRVLYLVTNQHWMKVVGSDIGKYEVSQLSPGEILAPGERVSYEVLFRDTGEVKLYHEMPDRLLLLGRIHVSDDSVATSLGSRYLEGDSNFAVSWDIDGFREAFSREPDFRMLITGSGKAKAKPSAAAKFGRIQHGPASIEGMIWNDTLGSRNADATLETSRWALQDLTTGLENEDIDWAFKKGQPVKIRVTNGFQGAVPMPHPIHFPGQRFLVTKVNGVSNPALAWKDVYLVPVGATADLVLDPREVGSWMARCETAEHSSTMALRFRVE